MGGSEGVLLLGIWNFGIGNRCGYTEFSGLIEVHVLSVHTRGIVILPA